MLAKILGAAASHHWECKGQWIGEGQHRARIGRLLIHVRVTPTYTELPNTILFSRPGWVNFQHQRQTWQKQYLEMAGGTAFAGNNRYILSPKTHFCIFRPEIRITRQKWTGQKQNLKIAGEYRICRKCISRPHLGPFQPPIRIARQKWNVF